MIGVSQSGDRQLSQNPPKGMSSGQGASQIRFMKQGETSASSPASRKGIWAMFRRRQVPSPPVPMGSAVSRHDFVDSLRLLGARLDVPHLVEVGKQPCEQQEVSLNCSRETWERVIGPPRNIICHYSPTKRGLYHSWEHHWVGGSVRCFGCLFERAADSHWLFLSRVLFFHHSSDMQPRCKRSMKESCESASQPA